MKVLFFITVTGHGKGGHFHSLNHISRALSSQLDLRIISIGPGRSNVINNNPFFKKHVELNNWNIFKFRSELKLQIEDYHPDLIHCFDITSFNLLNFLFPSLKNKILLNKCGGPSPSSYPFVQNLVLFSEENEIWFNSQKKYSKSRIHLIPNRVNKGDLQINDKPIEKENKFCFLRICRIGRYYQKSVDDAINLIKKLNDEKDVDCFLYIIGAVEDVEYFQELSQKIQGLPIKLITDEQYTKKASNLLYLGDAVIATGRGVMEATSLRKPLLTPVKNFNEPILINKENFQSFFKTNFSERNIASEIDKKNNSQNILGIIKYKQLLVNSQNESEIYFKTYFDVMEGVKDYINLYKEVIKNPLYSYNLKDLFYQSKTIISFIKNS